ncbi:hypothetical protein RQP46_001935 [Phenoliferia psychrophenolica]
MATSAATVFLMLRHPFRTAQRLIPALPLVSSRQSTLSPPILSPELANRLIESGPLTAPPIRDIADADLLAQWLASLTRPSEGDIDPDGFEQVKHLRIRVLFWKPFKAKYVHATLVHRLADAREKLFVISDRFAQHCARQETRALSMALVPLPSAPPAPKSLLGRSDLSNEILPNLSLVSGPVDPIVLVGPPGIGKTALALAAFHHDAVQANYERRHFIDCSLVGSIQGLQEELFRVAADAPNGLDKSKPWEDLVEFLQGRRTLIFLDRLEGLLEGYPTESHEFFTSLLRRSPTTTFLITTRFASPLPNSNRIVVGPLSKSSSSKLFKKLAVRHAKDSRLPELLHLLDGHPLALLLVATYAAREVSLGPVIDRWTHLGPDGFATHEDNLRLGVEDTFKRITNETQYELLTLLSLLAFLPFGLTRAHLTSLFDSQSLDPASLDLLESYGLFPPSSTLPLVLPAPFAKILAHPAAHPLHRPSRTCIKFLALAFAKDAGTQLLESVPTVPTDYGNALAVWGLAMRDLVDQPSAETRLSIDAAVLSLVQHQGSWLPNAVNRPSTEIDAFLDEVSTYRSRVAPAGWN